MSPITTAKLAKRPTHGTLSTSTTPRALGAFIGAAKALDVKIPLEVGPLDKDALLHYRVANSTHEVIVEARLFDHSVEAQISNPFFIGVDAAEFMARLQGLKLDVPAALDVQANLDADLPTLLITQGSTTRILNLVPVPEAPPLIDVQPSVSTEVNAGEMYDFLRGVTASDYATFKIEEEKLRVTAKGKAGLDSWTCQSLAMGTGESRYGIEWLKPIFAAAKKVAPKAVLQFSEAGPLLVEARGPWSAVQYTLSPRRKSH